VGKKSWPGKKLATVLAQVSLARLNFQRKFVRANRKAKWWVWQGLPDMDVCFPECLAAKLFSKV